jgi:heme-degrading monooxygenase HmoA
MPQNARSTWSANKFLLLLAFCLLTGCTLSTPFHYRDPAATQNVGEVVIGITHIVLKQDSKARATFWEAERRVDSVMLDQPGLIGYAKRLEVFGDEAWTMSAWVDSASLNAFVRSDAHQKAMADARNSYVDARFARTTIPSHRVPLSWVEVLAILERSARHYYE